MSQCKFPHQVEILIRDIVDGIAKKHPNPEDINIEYYSEKDRVATNYVFRHGNWREYRFKNSNLGNKSYLLLYGFNKAQLIKTQHHIARHVITLEKIVSVLQSPVLATLLNMEFECGF